MKKWFNNLMRMWHLARFRLLERKLRQLDDRLVEGLRRGDSRTAGWERRALKACDTLNYETPNFS